MPSASRWLGLIPDSRASNELCQLEDGNEHEAVVAIVIVSVYSLGVPRRQGQAGALKPMRALDLSSDGVTNTAAMLS